MTREALNMELQRIQQQQHKTVLFVTHDIEEAALLSDRVFVMSTGPGRVVDELKMRRFPRPRRIETKAAASSRRSPAMSEHPWSTGETVSG